MLKYFIYLTIFNAVFAHLSCRNANNEPVDWFVGYKLPKIVDTNHTGDEFLYADLMRPYWSVPEDIKSVNSSIGQTLQQYYTLKDDPEVFYMMYNDAHPDGKGDSYRGHSKGTVVFDKTSGFWLIHSVPNFPHPDSYIYPDSGYNNGQSFLCITFNAAALPLLAEHFTYTMPSIYKSQLPIEMAVTHQKLQNVIAKKSLPRGSSVFSIVLAIQSANGFPFVMLGKHKKFDADLYADLLAPHMACSFFTETWPNGATNYPDMCNTTNKDVYNIDSIKIENVIAFPNTKDHSKWAVAETPECGYVCIGDINRQISQRKRAGGTVCLQNPLIWRLYRSAVNDVEPCAV